MFPTRIDREEAHPDTFANDATGGQPALAVVLTWEIIRFNKLIEVVSGGGGGLVVGGRWWGVFILTTLNRCCLNHFEVVLPVSLPVFLDVCSVLTDPCGCFVVVLLLFCPLCSMWTGTVEHRRIVKSHRGVGGDGQCAGNRQCLLAVPKSAADVGSGRLPEFETVGELVDGFGRTHHVHRRGKGKKKY